MAVLKYKSGGNWYDLTVGMDQAAADARYVNVTGDTMTGALTLPADPTAALQAATKQYVDRAIPFGFLFWDGSSRAAGWSRFSTAPASQQLFGGMTAANACLVAPVAGQWLVTYTVQFTIAVSSCGVGVGNDAGVFDQGQSYSELTNKAQTFSGSTLLTFGAGSKFGLWTFQSGGANVGWAFLYVARIGT